ncbi:MAG: branched-chain amino acid ABC transporter permease [Bacillota bacterium]|jgi:branched-chain amino acid transport system permease protein
MNSKMLRNGIVVAVLLALPWVSNSYRLHLIIVSMLYMLTAIGLNLVLGYFGEMSLGQVAFFGTGAYTTAILTLKLGMPMGVSVLAGAVMASLLGWFVAFLCLRVKGPYFVIVTLSVANILRILSVNWVELTNGPMGLTGIRTPVVSLAGMAVNVSNKTVFYYLMLALVAICLLVANRMIRSHVGRAWISIREHPELSASVGVSRYAYGLAAILLAAAMAGLSGGMYAYYITIVTPDVFSFAFTIMWLIMVITGGKGTQFGPILGSVLFTMLPEFLRAIEKYRLVLFGIILLLVVLYMPQGIVPELENLYRRLADCLRRLMNDGGKASPEEAE